ncbi:MAG: ribonuclease III [Chlorobiaceae bacterium]|nr:ribonuclease III [Chlorobiaceae bacterium]
MEPFWQKITSFAFKRTEESALEERIAQHSLLSTQELFPETIAFLQKLTGDVETGLPLYRTALTHRSVVHDPATQHLVESNQRLEFLGDSVLGLLISAYLFRTFPESAEGELSSNRAKIVNRKSLAGFAETLNLGEHLLTGESADRNKITSSDSALADAFESLIGAIYLDKGIQAAENFIRKHVIEHENFRMIVEAEHNYKSRLIEYTQSRHLPMPLYTIEEESGAEHEKQFTVGVSCSDQHLGTGTARRKKDAEQLAAKEALSIIDAAEKDETPI